MSVFHMQSALFYISAMESASMDGLIGRLIYKQATHGNENKCMLY